ncbi:DUF4007 family protein [Aliarcobacter butzleri]|uniref:DUF4007 family protein n=1 Tax=Aliarcobacter butzleri TaxID=28197 RepID=UPI00214B0E74|nr:DUF4007 family protein [Aliarcobacter butzleri]MCP3650217.1 DUF4007 family protein [Arcobacter sp. DNRA7]MCR1816390.1 DUF4007 family protein [Aliarcobacter butzleri]
MSKIKTSFSGHDKFDCKIDWIVKGIKEYKENNTIFSSNKIENSIAKLGLGINMIKSLNHWFKVLGLVDNDKLSFLGELILEKDPFLENTDVLWIFHWNLVKNREKTTLYYLFFNYIYQYRFSKEDIFKYIVGWIEKNQINLSTSTLNSDIDVFLKMYSNSDNEEINLSLLSDLNILTKLKNSYSLNINSTAPISDDVFLYVLNEYINIFKLKENDSLSINDIQRGELSIQKIFCMSENKLFSKINQLHNLTNGKLSYSEAAGIRQIYITEVLDNYTLLKNILK